MALLVGAALLVLSGCSQAASPSPSGAAASGQPPSGQASGDQGVVAELALYSAPDRTQRLEEAARKEGKLMWYTGLIVDQLVRPLQSAFQKKYPFIQVEYYRGGSQEILQRVANEYKAGQYAVDVVDGIDSVAFLKRDSYLQPFNSPELAQIPAELKDADRTFGGLYSTFFVFGYNTKLAPPDQAPKTYQDLLNPKWKGKLVWSTQPSTGAPIFVGNVLQTMGEQPGMEYLKQLSQQNISNTAASTRAVLDQVIGGEYAVNVVAALNHVTISKAQGAPVDFSEPQPITGAYLAAGLARRAPHPAAALLLLDFLFSAEGQQVVADAQYTPTRSGVATKDPALQPTSRGVKVNFISGLTFLSEEAAWQKTFSSLFVR